MIFWNNFCVNFVFLLNLFDFYPKPNSDSKSELNCFYTFVDIIETFDCFSKFLLFLCEL